MYLFAAHFTEDSFLNLREYKAAVHKSFWKKWGNFNFAIGQFGASESDCECVLVFAIDCLNGEV